MGVCVLVRGLWTVSKQHKPPRDLRGGGGDPKRDTECRREGEMTGIKEKEKARERARDRGHNVTHIT